MKKFHLSPLKLLVHTSVVFLIAWLALDHYTGHLTINPIQAATQRTGRYALTFLALCLACTPINTLFGFRQAITVRRVLGLYAFMFASLHVYLLVGVDYGFDWNFLFADLAAKRYILAGFFDILILATLAITSFRWWMKKLGKNWKRLHCLVYLAGILTVIHYAWAVKGDILRFQGDILKPLAYGLAVVLLLILRLPSVKKQSINFRLRLNHRKSIAVPPAVKSPGSLFKE